MSYEGIVAESVTLRGHNDDDIEAYYGRPTGPGPFPGVVVLHHMPGWDAWTREVVWKLAYHGYAAVSPHLFSRSGPGSADDVAARARADGGVSDDQVVGDAEAAARFLRSQANANGRVGLIGFCSGGRQAWLCAARMPSLNAAVDCWGGGVIVSDPATLTPKRPVPVIDLTPQMTVPLLGIFGNDDANPAPQQVDEQEETLKRLGKTYEFYRYDGAGHGFFASDRPGYRPAQAVDAWAKVFAFYEKYLSTPVAEAAARS